MKKLLTFLVLIPSLFAQSANNLIITQWKPDGSGPIQRNIPTNNALISGNLQSLIDALGVTSRAANLSDLANAATARGNLGVTATGQDTTYAFRSNNLSDLANASTARSNLGLGSIATQNANNIAITGGAITGMPSPTFDSDVATKGYVDSIGTGIIPRTGVRVATTANITLSGTQTIDGVGVIAADRVLVKNQTAPEQNGIYTVAAGAWSRATDSNTAGELLFGYYYFVSSGTTQGSTSWFISVAPTTLDTDPVTFSQFSASQSYTAGTGLTLAGNQFSITSPIPLALGGTGGTDANTARISLGAAASASVLDKSNNLSDLTNVATARGNLGVAIGSNVQAYSATLQTLSGGSSSVQFTGPVGPTSLFALPSQNGDILTAPSGITSGQIVYGVNTTSRVKSEAAFSYNDASDLLSVPNINTGVINFDTAANRRTTKGNYNIVVNIKDYGAVGDNSTNDTAAIASAVSALPATGGILVIPPGIFITDEINISGKTNLTIVGSGIGVSTLKGRTGNRVLVISSSTGVDVSGITFNGNCTARTAGQQAVTINASQVRFVGNEVLKSGEYAVFFGSGATPARNVLVANNIVRDTYADGINFQYVLESSIVGNVIDGSDDDCIAVGYNGSGRARGIIVANNYCRSRNDLGTNWGRGIAIIGAIDVVVANNFITEIKQTGLYIHREAATGPCNRILVTGNHVADVAIHSGHAAVMMGTVNCTFTNNTIQSPYQGSLLDIADWEHLTISNNDMSQHRNVFGRAIHADEGTGWSNTTWYNLVVKDNTIRLTGAATNSGIYLNPHTTYTMQRGLVMGNNVQQTIAGDYITLGSARCSTLWKVVNNVDMTSGRTINVSTGGIFTVTNNN